MSLKINKKKVKQIALSRFHDKHFDTPLDLVVHAIEVWLKEGGLKIVKVPDDATQGGNGDSTTGA